MLALFECCMWAWIAELVLLIIFGLSVIRAEIVQEQNLSYVRESGLDLWAFLSLAAFLAILQFGTPVNPFEWFKANMVNALVLFIIYLTIGFGWSVFKWFRFVRKKFKEYRKKREIYAESFQFRDAFPETYKYKGMIVRWILTWPFSLFWALTCDLLIWIGNHIYDLFGQIYKRISNIIFKDFFRDMEELKKREEEYQEKKIVEYRKNQDENKAFKDRCKNTMSGKSLDE